MTYDQLRERCDQLQEALDSRVVIEQAKGFLIATTGRPADECFNILRRFCRSHQLKLRTVAELIVARKIPCRVVVEGARAGSRPGRKEVSA